MDLAMLNFTGGDRGITLRATPPAVRRRAITSHRNCGGFTHRPVTVIGPFSSEFGATSTATAPAGVAKKIVGKRRHCGGVAHSLVTIIAPFSSNGGGSSTATAPAGFAKKAVAKVYRTNDAERGNDELRSEVSLEGLFLSSDDTAGKEDEQIGGALDSLEENSGFGVLYLDDDAVGKEDERIDGALNSLEEDAGFTVEDGEIGSTLNSSEEDFGFRVEDEENGSAVDSLEEDLGFRVVMYLEPWQMKKMVAASNLGARCVDIDALATEVGLDRSDVLAWLENASSKVAVLNSNDGSYMEDVHIVEEVEKPAIYVQPPPIPAREVNMRRKVEDLMYSLKAVMSGSLDDIITNEESWSTIVKLFSEQVELQNPLFCLRGRDGLFDWVQLLGRLGAVVKLLDIYYENTASKPYNRWVYATWTASLTDDLGKSLVELGLADWWARFHGPEPMNSPEIDNKQHALGNQSMQNRKVLQLSGDWRFEMEESGQVTDVRSRWYKLAEQGGGEDLMDAKLWLSGILRRESC